MTCIIDDKESRELAKVISRFLCKCRDCGRIPLTQEYMESIIYQELKRNPINKTEE